MRNRTILLVEDNPKDELLTLRALNKCHLAELGRYWLIINEPPRKEGGKTQ